MSPARHHPTARSRTPERPRPPIPPARRPPTAAGPTDRRGSTRSTTLRASRRLHAAASGTKPPRPTGNHRYVLESQRDWRIRFVDFYLDGVDAISAHDVVGDLAGHAFHHVPGRPADQLPDSIRDRAVVQRDGK